jgi:assimilatory nitrate reductase catalytic subunit
MCGRSAASRRARSASRCASRTTAFDGLLADLGLADPATLRYDDPKRGLQRRVRTDAAGRLLAFAVIGDTASAPWMRDWLLQAEPLPIPGRLLLAGGAQPPVARPAVGALVCSCHGVGEATIRSRLASDGADDGDAEGCLARLQADLKCGTSCGSCLPALKALVREKKVPA